MPLLSAYAAVALLMSSASEEQLSCKTYIDFSNPLEVSRWRVVNDGVMGGRSSGSIQPQKNALRYAGTINTNGGGFSSIRRSVQVGELSNAVAMRINYIGDGRRYKLSLRSSGRRRGLPISFQAVIPTKTTSSLVMFDDLRGSFRGRAIPGARFDAKEVIEMGVILSDGVDGPFEMDISSIELCNLASGLTV